MNDYLKTKYKMKNCTKEKLHDLNFKYDFGSDMYFIKFPVIIENKIPIMFCELGVILETSTVILNIKKANGSLYAPWYNESNVHEPIINRINMNISRKFKELDIHKHERKSRRKKHVTTIKKDNKK